MLTQPWQQINSPDPNQEYVAFTSRFAMRSVLRLPAWLRISQGIRRQVESAPGAVGYSLGFEPFRLNFYTLSAWESEAHLHAFAAALDHGKSMQMFGNEMRTPSIFVQWRVSGSKLPLDWTDALARQKAKVAE